MLICKTTNKRSFSEKKRKTLSISQDSVNFANRIFANTNTNEKF